MAQWSLLVLAACVCGAFAVPVIDDPIAFRNATFEKCQKQENAPADAMKDLFYFKSAEGLKDHKCATKCIDEEYGIYEKDGTINKEVMVGAIKSLWNDAQILKKLINISIACVDSVDHSLDPCEVSYNMIDCLLNYIKKEGLAMA